jgi:hypothetical protein
VARKTHGSATPSKTHFHLKYCACGKFQHISGTRLYRFSFLRELIFGIVLVPLKKASYGIPVTKQWPSRAVGRSHYCGLRMHVYSVDMARSRICDISEKWCARKGEKGWRSRFKISQPPPGSGVTVRACMPNRALGVIVLERTQENRPKRLVEFWMQGSMKSEISLQ